VRKRERKEERTRRDDVSRTRLHSETRFRKARGARKRCRDIVARTARGECTRDAEGEGEIMLAEYTTRTRAPDRSIRKIYGTDDGMRT